ncbi:Plug domain-containing protein, partial [Klebsiella pneumoniae]|nr:Plug domain-containing protein [Klebsiella pneumoniae]
DTLSDLSVNNKYVVTKEDIERKQARTVAQALNGIPGLMVTQLAGGHERFDMRGQGATAASNVIVLYNGIPLNSIDMAGVNTRQIAV